jgi:glutamate 5-kinase
VGGMISKIEAAKLATSSGTDMIIADGSNRSVLTSLLKKTVIGTLFHKINFS